MTVCSMGPHLKRNKTDKSANMVFYLIQHNIIISTSYSNTFIPRTDDTKMQSANIFAMKKAANDKFT